MHSVEGMYPQPQLCYFPAVGTWARHKYLLSLSYLLSKMKTLRLLRGLLRRLNEIIYLKQHSSYTVQVESAIQVAVF